MWPSVCRIEAENENDVHCSQITYYAVLSPSREGPRRLTADVRGIPYLFSATLKPQWHEHSPYYFIFAAQNSAYPEA